MPGGLEVLASTDEPPPVCLTKPLGALLVGKGRISSTIGKTMAK